MPHAGCLMAQETRPMLPMTHVMSPQTMRVMGCRNSLFSECCHSWTDGDPGGIKAEYVSNVIQWSVSALTAATQTRGPGTGGRGQTQDKVGFYLRNIPDTNPSFWQLLWSDTRSVIILMSIFAACLSPLYGVTTKRQV